MEEGRIVALWPGSSLHAQVVLEYPRFEDFEYALLPEAEGDQMAYFGNGLTVSQEKDEKTTAYLDKVDIPPIINHGKRPTMEKMKVEESKSKMDQLAEAVGAIPS